MVHLTNHGSVSGEATLEIMVAAADKGYFQILRASEGPFGEHLRLPPFTLYLRCSAQYIS